MKQLHYALKDLTVLPCSLPTIQQGIALPDPLLLFFLPRRQISIDCITQNLLASGFQFAATDKWLRYWPSQVGPEQKCPFCSVSFEPIEWDGVGFRRKGKLHSLIRGWRGVSWGSSVCALLERPRRDCFIGILSVGRSRSSQGVGAAVLHVPDCSAGCGVCTRPSWAAFSYQELRSEASAPGTLWAPETQLSTEGPTVVLCVPLFPSGLWVWPRSSTARRACCLVMSPAFTGSW